MTLAERMKRFRALNNMSQTEFGKLCGLTQNYLSNIENGKNEPGEMARTKIELVLSGEKTKE